MDVALPIEAVFGSTAGTVALAFFVLRASSTASALAAVAAGTGLLPT